MHRHLHRGHATRAIALGAHNGPKFLDVLLHGAADDGVAVVAPAFHFERGIAETDLHLLLGLGSATQESLPQLLKIGRNDEDVGQRIQNQRIAAGADIRRAMRVDIEQDIDPVVKVLQDGRLQRTVPVAMNLGMFQKLPGFKTAGELIL